MRPENDHALNHDRARACCEGNVTPLLLGCVALEVRQRTELTGSRSRNTPNILWSGSAFTAPSRHR